jgi:TRAP-type uncharacterized transport system substrate-binding protein
MRDFLKVYAPIAILLVVGFAVASRFVNPAPPRHVRMAAGAPQGAYAETAKRYRDILARDGITLEVVTTQGSLDNLRLLQATTGGVDVAFVQGGTGSPDLSGLASIGSVFFEPLWIFVRDGIPVRSLADLQGRPLAIGAEGSGTRALTLQLLQVSGIPDGALLLPLGGTRRCGGCWRGRWTPPSSSRPARFRNSSRWSARSMFD